MDYYVFTFVSCACACIHGKQCYVGWYCKSIYFQIIKGRPDCIEFFWWELCLFMKTGCYYLWDSMFIVLMTCLWDMSWIISRSVMNWASMTMLHRVLWFSLAPVFLLSHYVISGCLCMFSPSLAVSSSEYKYITHSCKQNKNTKVRTKKIKSRPEGSNKQEIRRPLIWLCMDPKCCFMHE